MIYGIMSGIADSIGDAVAKFFYSLLWKFIRAFTDVIGEVQKALYYITGVWKLPITQTGDASLLEALFGISHNNNTGAMNIDFGNGIHKAFIGMLFVFAVLLVFCLICGAIKVNLNRQDKESLPSTQKMLWKSLVAFGMVCIIPIFFCLFMAFCGEIMTFIFKVVGQGALSGSDSLTDGLLHSCISETKLNLIQGEDANWKDVIVSSMSWGDFQDKVGYENFNWGIYLLGTSCMGVGIIMAGITVAERLINIILLYIISPAVVATIPLDDGKRWENWKEITIAKVVTVAGNLLSLFIYLYIVTKFGNSILESSGDVNGTATKLTMTVCFLFIAISGAFMAAKGGTLIASIISSNQGQQEGMSFMASSKLLGMGAKVAGATAGAAWHIAKGNSKTNKDSGNKNAKDNSSGGGSGGNGGGGGNSDTAYNGEKGTSGDQFNKSKDVNDGKLASPGNNEAGGEKEKGIAGKIGDGVEKAAKLPGKVLDDVKKVGGAIKDHANVPTLIKAGTKVGALAIAGAGIAVLAGGKALAKGFKSFKNGLKEKLGKNKFDKSSLDKSIAKDKNVKTAIGNINENNKNLAKSTKEEANANKAYGKELSKQQKFEKKADAAYEKGNVAKYEKNLDKALAKQDKVDQKREKALQAMEKSKENRNNISTSMGNLEKAKDNRIQKMNDSQTTKSNAKEEKALKKSSELQNKQNQMNQMKQSKLEQKLEKENNNKGDDK